MTDDLRDGLARWTRTIEGLREVRRRAGRLDRALAERGPPRSSRRRGWWLAALVQGPVLVLLVAATRPGPQGEAVAAAVVADPPALPRAPEPAPAVVAPEPEPEEEPEPEVEGVVVVDELPFVHRGDTRDSRVRLVDAYGCAPEIPESGPEVWYRLELREAGVLTASILEDRRDGIDVDLHLLSAVDGAACLARDNERIVTPIAPGRYWLVLDSWGTALQKPGSYRLQVELAPVR
jgi:hypothetical protein